MPTISESTWPEREQRTARYVDEFVHNQDITCQPSILKALLFSNGLRGEDLESAVACAVKKRELLKAQPNKPTKVLVLERDGTRTEFRFNTDFNAGRAVEVLRKQPNVLFASRVYR